MGHDRLHISFSRGSCENRFAPIVPDPSSDEHLLPTSPRPVRSCPDFQNLQPLATPCLLLAVRTCTTSLHKETCSCCPSLFPPLHAEEHRWYPSAMSQPPATTPIAI